MTRNLAVLRQQSTEVQNNRISICDCKKMMILSRTKLMATGDGAGAVMVWKLNDSLTEQTPRDQEILNDIASSHLN